MCPPLGNLIGNVANGVNGTCGPIPAFRSNTSSAIWPLRLPVRANSFPYLPTAWRTRSGSSANSLMPVPLRLSGYVLTRNVPMVSTSLWSRYVYNWMPCSQPPSLPSKTKSVVSDWPLPKVAEPNETCLVTAFNDPTNLTNAKHAEQKRHQTTENSYEQN